MQAIKGPSVVNGQKLYIDPEEYEGQECDPLIFCTGPVPAQQVEPLIPWLMQQTGAKRFYLPSADYIWPHTWRVCTAASTTTRASPTPSARNSSVSTPGSIRATPGSPPEVRAQACTEA